jgi:hypothetical protein
MSQLPQQSAVAAHSAMDPDYRKRKSTKKNPQPKMHVGQPGDEMRTYRHCACQGSERGSGALGCISKLRERGSTKRDCVAKLLRLAWWDLPIGASPTGEAHRRHGEVACERGAAARSEHLAASMFSSPFHPPDVYAATVCIDAVQTIQTRRRQRAATYVFAVVLGRGGGMGFNNSCVATLKFVRPNLSC